MRLDFFARYTNHIDHIAPIWNHFPLDRRGTFYVTEKTADYARQELGEIVVFDGDLPYTDNPVLVSSHGDILRADRSGRKHIVHIEHGIGHGFGTPPYPNGSGGARDRVSLFLAPNDYTARKMRAVRDVRVEVVGTPKMDSYVGSLPAVLENRSDPLIAIGFHWGDKHSQPPESGSAFEHFERILPVLKERYRMIGHGHPLAMNELAKAYERAGIEIVRDFREVLRRADVFVNDLSSVLYEFLVTGKPVVLLNAPWFRRSVHWGIRFWDYSEVGIQVERAAFLPYAIDMTIQTYESTRVNQRREAVMDLYPYLGSSTQRAVSVLQDYMEAIA